MLLIYRPIEQLQKLATGTNTPYSDAQQLEFILTLIRSTRDFEKRLSDWNGKVQPDKTWLNFKNHFKDVQTELKDIHGPTMQQVGFHHANMLAEQLRTKIDTQGTEILVMLQDLFITDNSPPIEDMPPPTALLAPTASVAAHTNMQI